MGATSLAMNGNNGRENGQEPATFIGPRGLINRVEYIRILQQALIQLGYPEIGKLIEEKSGIIMQPQSATEFRDAVLSGDFEAAVGLLPQLAPSDSDKERARFLILRHKYIECIRRGDTKAALRCLRTELQPLEGASTSKVLQSLAAMLLNSPDATNGQTLVPSSSSSHEDVTGRESLLNDLQSLLPPSVLVPEARLEELIEQALLAQLERCPYHNSSTLHMSLLSDYSAGPEQLPTCEAQVLTSHTDEVWWVEFSSDGKWMVSGSKDGSALLWSITPAGQVTLSRTISKGTAAVNIATFSRNSQNVLVSTCDGFVRVYTVADGKKVCECNVGGQGHSAAAAAWLPDSQRFFAITPDRTLLIFDVEHSGMIVKRLKQTQHIYDAVLSSDGGTIVMVGQDRRLQYLRLDDLAEAFVGPESAAVTCLCASPDGRFVAANLATGVIHLWPLGDLRAPPDLEVTTPLRPRATDPLDALPTSPLQEYRMRDDRPGRYVIRSSIGGAGCGFVSSGSEDGQVFIWHRETGELLATMPGHKATVNVVAWNPKNQHMLASASDDGTIRVWVAPAMFDGAASGSGRATTTTPSS